MGYSYVTDADTGELRYAVSIVVKLSDAIIDEIPEFNKNGVKVKFIGLDKQGRIDLSIKDV